MHISIYDLHPVFISNFTRDDVLRFTHVILRVFTQSRTDFSLKPVFYGMHFLHPSARKHRLSLETSQIKRVTRFSFNCAGNSCAETMKAVRSSCVWPTACVFGSGGAQLVVDSAAQEL
jgi:hypothetical protein